MKVAIVISAAMALVLLNPSAAAAKDKKHLQRGMLEKMQSVPCGMRERGLTNLGALYAGVGVQHVNSNEKLCPQYLFRTDEMDYHIRPLDSKHPPLLPIGKEAEFRIKKDMLYLKVADSDHKMQPYHVISVEPVNSEGQIESTRYKGASAGGNQPPAQNKQSNQAVTPAPQAPAPTANPQVPAPAQNAAPASQQAQPQSVPAAQQVPVSNQNIPPASQASSVPGSPPPPRP